MPHIFRGDKGSAAGKYAIVVSKYNDNITSKLLAGATETLVMAGDKQPEASGHSLLSKAFGAPYQA